MSVIIKGMEMPKNCAECKFLCSENFKSWCHVTDRDDVYVDAVPDWCPLAELPEKHGRLVDADALIAEWKDVLNTDGISPMFAMILESAIRDVERAKVLVEAEGEEQ